MKVLVFGGTGMLGQGVIRECLLDPIVTVVQTVGRTPTTVQHPKMRDIVHSNMFDYSGIENYLRDFDACFFCLGVSSAGMSEADYHHMTYDLTIAAAQTLAKLNPLMTFIYVSGDGTDSTEKGKIMWARVKGKTENELFRLFKNAYMFRPGIIEPKNGAISKTKVYRLFYTFGKPLLPLMHALAPNSITTTELVGRAMLKITKSGFHKKFLSNKDINEAGKKT